MEQSPSDHLEHSPQEIAPRQRDHGEDPANGEVLPERRRQGEQREHEQLRRHRYGVADDDIRHRLDERHQLPGSLRGGAAGKVVGALLSRGFIEELVIDDTRPADPALNTLWRTLEDGRGVLPRITQAGREALGIELDSAAKAGAEPEEPAPAIHGRAGPESAAQAPTEARPRRTREGTKQALLVGLLGRDGGATIAEIVAATGWQPHTVRGAFAGALKKRLGLTVTSEKVEGRGRVYRSQR
jgi:hypothetical protein